MECWDGRRVGGGGREGTGGGVYFNFIVVVEGRRCQCGGEKRRR